MSAALDGAPPDLAGKSLGVTVASVHRRTLYRAQIGGFASAQDAAGSATHSDSAARPVSCAFRPLATPTARSRADPRRRGELTAVLATGRRRSSGAALARPTQPLRASACDGAFLECTDAPRAEMGNRPRANSSNLACYGRRRSAARLRTRHSAGAGERGWRWQLIDARASRSRRAFAPAKATRWPPRAARWTPTGQRASGSEVMTPRPSNPLREPIARTGLLDQREAPVMARST